VRGKEREREREREREMGEGVEQSVMAEEVTDSEEEGAR
jgi:hypothetical protein